ncbi:hypothetical protein ACVWXQ_003098 [Bradyrhizobium sp. S3.14.4]
MWRCRETITPAACGALQQWVSIERIIDIDQIGQQRTGCLAPITATVVTVAHVTTPVGSCDRTGGRSPRRHQGAYRRDLGLQPRQEALSLLLKSALVGAHPFEFVLRLARILLLPFQAEDESLLLCKLPLTFNYLTLDLP